MLFRIPFLVCFWSRVGHKKICTRFGGQKQNIHVYAQKVSTESGAVTAHTRHLRSTGSHCFRGTAIGPMFPSVPTFKTHPIAFNSWAKYVFSYMTKDSAPFASHPHHRSWRFWRKQENDTGLNSPSWAPHQSCRVQFVLAVPYFMSIFLPDYLPSRLQKHKQQSHTSCLTSSHNCINIKSL